MKRLINLAALVSAFITACVLELTRPRRSERDDEASNRSSLDPVRLQPRLVMTIAAALVALAGVAGLLVAASGIVPIKASSGHWAITRWFLEFSMARSVSTHAMLVDAPPLDDPDLLMKGAGHYDFGCRPCHGSPDLGRPRIPAGMTPEPPYLPEVVAGWNDEELFYIVKHGVKMTGMPAWSSQRRDDEVWAVVAFLRRLPRLDRDAYRRLAGIGAGPASLDEVARPADVPQAVATSCANCHGADGRGRNGGAFPRLAGQRPGYLAASLEAYAEGRRHSGIMEPVAAGLSLDEMNALARYYAGFPAAALEAPPDSPAMERGRRIASGGVPSRHVPACAACHEGGAALRNPVYPVLAGQYAEYLVLQLELFSQGRRGGTPYAHIMTEVVHDLTPDEIRDVARYYAASLAGVESEAP